MGENSSSKPNNQTEKQRNHLYSGRQYVEEMM